MLLLISWGFYTLRGGDIKLNISELERETLPSDLEDQAPRDGLVATFVWAFTDANQARGALVGAMSSHAL
jgi:hypothetical protein